MKLTTFKQFMEMLYEECVIYLKDGTSIGDAMATDKYDCYIYFTPDGDYGDGLGVTYIEAYLYYRIVM